MRIQVKESIYLDILAGNTGNGSADAIPAILEEKKREGYEVVITDDFTDAVIRRL